MCCSSPQGLAAQQHRQRCGSWRPPPAGRAALGTGAGRHTGRAGGESTARKRLPQHLCCVCVPLAPFLVLHCFVRLCACITSTCLCDPAAKCFASIHSLCAAPFPATASMFPATASAFPATASTVPAAASMFPATASTFSLLSPKHRSRHASSSPTPGSTAATAPLPVLPASAWQLGAVVESDAAGIEGSGAGSSSGAGAAAAQEDDVPPLDLALLCGRAILPGNLALLLQEEGPRR